MCRQHAEDLRTRAEAQLHAEEQHAALIAAMAAQHASQLQALQGKHAAEQQESARCSAVSPAHKSTRKVPKLQPLCLEQDDSYLAVMYACRCSKYMNT